MEFISWFLHKYIFHGPLWFIHKTHHARTFHSSFELNDVFTFIFASISVVFIWIGWFNHSPTDLAVGIGMVLYGLIYFLIHDGLIHQRYSSWAKAKNRYLKQVQRAHHRHHAFPHKTPSEEFGLLLMISPTYWREMFVA